jgi:hypothetical protein
VALNYKVQFPNDTRLRRYGSLNAARLQIEQWFAFRRPSNLDFKSDRRIAVYIWRVDDLNLVATFDGQEWTSGPAAGPNDSLEPILR